MDDEEFRPHTKYNCWCGKGFKDDGDWNTNYYLEEGHDREAERSSS